MNLLKEEYRFLQNDFHGITPVSYGQQKCERGFSVEVPRPYWLLHYIVQGKGSFNTGGVSYTVSPSQIFVVRPHQMHSYTADEETPWHYIWVSFYCNVPIPRILETDILTAPAAGKIFSDILSATEFDCGKEEFVTAKVWELFSLFRRMEQGSKQLQNPYIAAAKEYIAHNYMRGIKVTDIAKSVNLDRSYFSTLFKNQTGMAPQQYLSEYRLERAAEMLLKKQGSVTDAAYLSGYSDNVNFSRMFKKHFGTTPSKYREMILLNEGRL